MTTTIRSSADGSKSYIAVGGTDRVTIGSQGIEAGSYKPGSIAANDFADGALIENTPVGMGYGPGAGGTVTQATSKSTAVTLNKPTGRITTTADALAAGASVLFTFYNSLISTQTVLAVNGDYLTIDPTNYRIEVAYVGGGQAKIKLTNISAGSLSQAVDIMFAVITGSFS